MFNISSTIKLWFLPLLISVLLPLATEAASVDNLQVLAGTNLLKVRGSCTGRQVAIHLFSEGVSEPFYTAGAECKNGAFNFKDDLEYWKISAGNYRVVVYDENSPRANPSREEEFRIENVTIVETEETEVPAETNETAPEANDNSSGDGILQTMWETFQNIGELIKSALASLGFYIENGIARVTELIVGKIVADTANIKNLEVSEKIQLRDQATGENYCAWLENGEWTKRLGQCQDAQNNVDTEQNGAEENTDQATEAPVVEEPVVEPSAVEAPAVNEVEPVEVEQPVVEPSAVEPDVVEPAAKTPAVEEPAVEPPVQE